MTQDVITCRVKLFCFWWSFKPTVSPVITMAIHMFVQWAFGFSYILFVATAARDQIDNILCLCSASVLQCPQKMTSQYQHGLSFCSIDIFFCYHFAALASFSAAFSVVQSMFCLSLTVAPEDDFTVPAGVIILQHWHLFLLSLCSIDIFFCNSLCCAVCVLPQSYSGPRRWLHSTSRDYHFTALTSFSVIILQHWHLFHQQSMLCSLCSASVLQWPKKMTSQYQQISTKFTDHGSGLDVKGQGETYLESVLRLVRWTPFVFWQRCFIFRKMKAALCINRKIPESWPRGYKTWALSQTQNKAQWLAAGGHVSAGSQSLHFILSVRLYSSVITSWPGRRYSNCLYMWEKNRNCQITKCIHFPSSCFQQSCFPLSF